MVLRDSSVELVSYCCPAVCNYQDQKIKCKVNSKKKQTSDDQSSDLLLHGRSMTAARIAVLRKSSQ